MKCKEGEGTQQLSRSALPTQQAKGLLDCTYLAGHLTHFKIIPIIDLFLKEHLGLEVFCPHRGLD